MNVSIISRIYKLGITSVLAFVFLFVSSHTSFAAITINEIYPAGSSSWIELLNSDATAEVNLTGYKITSENPATVLKTLNGKLPKKGMLTFSSFAPSIGSSGCLMIINPSNTPVFALSYGSEANNCSEGSQYSGMTIGAGQSVYYNLAGESYNVGSPTKGWCNPGTTGCPTIATIVSAIEAGGVTTNLGSVDDFTRINGLYFEKTGRGKIEFSSEMNLTDVDAFTWMSALDSKLDLSTANRISLDADLIKNLMSTNAALTMYNVNLNNPEILVNGQSDTGNVVSSIVYTKSTGTLTFNVAHFTRFDANERQSSSSTSSSGTTRATIPSCNDAAPGNAPELFQVDTYGDHAVLHFTPANDHVSYYQIRYGYSTGDERFGVVVPYGLYSGVISYTIGGLPTNTNFSYSVRAGNGCMPGPWSNWLGGKTSSYSTTAPRSTYLYN